jgi:hypothetical protein
MRMKARGPELPMPSMPLGDGVTVELRRSDAAACWATRFDAPVADDAKRFRAAHPRPRAGRPGRADQVKSLPLLVLH